MNLPLVSVFVPNYNNAEFLKECINSILSQTYENIEIIISDDASTDRSIDILQQYQDKIIIHQNGFNLGLVENVKLANSLCSGEFVMIVDSDDFIAPNCVQLMLDTAIREKVDIVGCQVQTVGLESGVSNFPIRSNDIVACLYLGNSITYSGSLIRKEVLDKVEKHSKPAHDYLFWIDVAIANYKFRNIPEIGLFYRKHESNETRVNSALLDEVESKHRLHALHNLSDFEYSVREEFIHTEMVSKNGLSRSKDVESALKWLSRLETLSNKSDNTSVREYYRLYAMRVARKNAFLGWAVAYHYLLSDHASGTKLVDILALFIMTIFKFNSKHDIPNSLKWLFYLFKR